MIFEKTALEGVLLVKPQLHEDSRGTFARTYCEKEFQAQAVIAKFCQCNISFNAIRGTLRGMHFQEGEGKLVRCTRGAIHDVALDIRPQSKTFGKWFSQTLTQANRTALYIPPGFAHGFQSLENETEVFYQMTDFYQPEKAKGIRWNDPKFAIQWPIDSPILSERDQSFPLFSSAS